MANQISAEQFDTVMPLLQELYRGFAHTRNGPGATRFWRKGKGDLELYRWRRTQCAVSFSSGQPARRRLGVLLSIHLIPSLVPTGIPCCLTTLSSISTTTGRSTLSRCFPRSDAPADRSLLRSKPGTGRCSLPQASEHVSEPGRRFDLAMSITGSGSIAEVHDVVPLPREILRPAQAS